jgi:hypothetical protein
MKDLLPKEITIADKYSPAMTIETQEDADAYFERLVFHSEAWFGFERDEAVILERANLGYFAAYYNNETRERVERLFKCEHPVFGSIVENGPPTPEAAFQAGVAMAKEA